MDRGNEVTVVTLDPTIDVPLHIREAGLTAIYLPLRGPPRFRTRVRSLDLFEFEIRHLVSAIQQSSADFVHAHWTYEFAEAAVRSKLPHLVTMHDLGWEYLRIYRDGYRAMRLVMKYRVMPRVRNLTVVAPFMASKAWQYGYFRRPYTVPNGVAVTPTPKPRQPIGGDKPLRIVTIGNAGPIKNVSAAVSALSIIRERFPAAELHLFGPGLDRAYVGGTPGVIGHGPRPHDELMTFLSRTADLLVHPSRLECCPMIIAEAKMRGVPVVGGRRSGGVAYVCGEAGAEVVNIENPREIAHVAISMLAPERYREASRLARIDAEDRFASQIVTSQYISIYERVFADAAV
jgi:glycosyltransferase involved in cell wall biosynthesis